MPYKVYIASLSQTGTSAPVPTVFENTIGDIVWSYDGVGSYFATLLGAFSSLKVWISITNPNSAGCSSYGALSSVDSIQVLSFNISFTLANDTLLNSSVEIRVYP